MLFSKSPYYSQVCALANLRLVFFADDFLEFEASGRDADFGSTARDELRP